MKALVLTDYMKLEFMNVPDPTLSEEDVLIQIKVASVCGSDIHGINGKSLRRNPPIIMGHEASGVIVKMGRNVKDFQIGDRVTFNSSLYCNECSFCLEGKRNLCESGMVVGVSTDTFHKDGAFAEYLAVPQHVLYPLPPTVTFLEAALIEPIAVAMHAISLLPIKTDDTVVLFGTGTIATFAIQLLKLKPLSQLIVVGRNKERLELALELGATAVINSKEVNVKDQVFALTNGQGAACTCDMAGAQSTFTDGLACLKKGGTFSTIANLTPEFTIDMTNLIMRELTLKGSCVSNGEYSDIIPLLEQKKIRTDYIISAQIPLSEGGDFIMKLHNNEIPNFGKLILIP